MANRIILNETSYFGAGAISVIADEAKKRGYKKALVVTDKSLMKFEVATKVLKVLDDAGLAYEVFDDCKPNPTIQNVQDGVAACKKGGRGLSGRHRRRFLHGHCQGHRHHHE